MKHGTILNARALLAMICAVALLALLLIYGAGSLGRAAAAPPDYRGVYVATRPMLTSRRAVPDAVYSSPAASGVYLETVWAQLEPQRGRYDFAVLDREVRRAVAARKKISLSIIAGGRSPGWLAAQGAKTLRFAIGRGKANACTTIDVPLPWDPVYQDRYARLMSAVAGRLSQLGATEAVRIVKLTGVGRITEELRLPLSIGRQAACGEGDADARWAAAGYRPARLVSAWLALAKSVGSAFPGALLSLDVLERNDLPSIDDAGRKATYIDLKPKIVAAARQAFPGRFAVQWNGLNPAGRVADFPVAARRSGAALGWQTNMFRGFEGSGCGPDRRQPPVPCDAGTYRKLLDRGVASGAGYIEIWPEDLARFPDAVAEADRRLKSAGR